MKKMTIVTYTVSLVGISLFVAHFWHLGSIVGVILWGIAVTCAIFSIYGGIIGHSQDKSELGKAYLKAATVMGCLMLLGLTISAVFLLVPAIG
ncbi:MAG: hypothetical protein OEZ00_00930 [Dehalococcoidia bacterium]|nr:hypothetical protein [Dehalococcoidia bacterium]